MNDRKRFLYLLLIMTVAVLVVATISNYILYQTAFEEERDRLVETVQSQARLIEAVARFDAIYSNDYPEGSYLATISQIIDAHKSYKGFGKTGEFTLAKLEGDSIVFLLSHRHHDLNQPHPVSFFGEEAQPMQRALSGKSGTIVGLDYRGEKVLAAYEPVATLNLGLVAKIDLSEIRAPFIRTSLIAYTLAVMIVLIGSLLFLRISNPVLLRLQEYSRRLEGLVNERTAELTTTNEQLRVEITERKQAEDALRNIAEGVSATTGEAFFQSLVQHLSNTLESDYVFVGELDSDEPESIKTIAVCANGNIADNFEYKLADTPCKNVVGEQLCVYPERVQQQFPKDHLLVEMEVEGYAGSPLFDSDGNAIGLLVVLDGKPINNPELVKSMLQIFAVRASAELERKRAGEALRESEQRYRSLVETSPDAIISINEESKILFVNPAAEKIFGYTGAELLGQQITMLMPENLRDAHIASFKQYINTGKRQISWKAAELPGRCKEGIEIPLAISFGEYTEKGKRIVTAIVRDITERKQAEEELRKYHDHLEDLVQERTREIEVLAEFPKNNPNPVLKCNKKGDIIYVNPAMEHFMRELELDTCKNIKECFPGLYKKIIKIISTDKTIINQEIELNGKVLLLSSNSFQDEESAFILIHDITQRKEMEVELDRYREQLEELVEKRTAEINFLLKQLQQERDMFVSGPVVLFKWQNQEGWPVEYVSPNAENIFGYSVDEFVSGKVSYAEIISEEDIERVSSEVKAYSESGTDKFNHEPYRIVKKDGETIWLADYTTILRDETGKIIHYLGYVIDITERKRAEMELRQAKQQAEISDRLKSTFLSIMSHEVRTPLNAMLGFNDLLALELREKLSDEQKGFVETIQNSGERLKNLMDDILDISQIEADRTALKLGSFIGDDLVMKSVTGIALTAWEKNLEVIEEYKASELRIRLDDLRYQQAVGNILHNAVKFTHEGSITVSTKAENDEYRVVVKDTGIGIRDKFKPYLFSLFRQAEEGYDRSYEGAGLGLAISQRLVEAMNGRIEVESKVGEGSTFSIIMPAEREEASADRPKVAIVEEVIAQTPIQPTVPSVKEKTEKATVLILEDNPANMKFNEFLVRKLDLNHLSAGTGEKALELLKGKSVDGMLIDISLAEGMTGIEFLKKVKRMKQFKNVPMIAVTAHSMVGDRERFLNHGFDDYLEKPFKLEDLKNTLKRNLVLE